jgi:hypothetical protein
MNTGTVAGHAQYRITRRDEARVVLAWRVVNDALLYAEAAALLSAILASP